MRKTKMLIFTLVTIWLALYVTIAFSHTPTIASPAVVSGVSMQRDSYTPSLAMIEQRFQAENGLDQAQPAYQVMPVPVTGGGAGEPWIGIVILFSAVSVVGISGLLIVRHA